MLNCSAGLSSTINSRLRRGIAYSLMRVKTVPSSSEVVGLVTKENAPRDKAVVAVFIERQHLNRNVPGGRILLQVVEHRPAQHVRKENIERNGGRVEFAGQSKRFRAASGHQDLETVIVGQIAQDAGVVRIVFDNQQNGILRLQIFAVVGDLLDEPLGNKRAGRLNERSGRQSLFLRHADAGRRTNIGLRQVESEHAAFAGSAAQLNFSAEQAGQFAADREPQSGAAVLAAGARIGLLEGLEDDSLFFRRNADAGVRNFEGDDGRRAGKDRMRRAPSAFGHGYGKADASLLP